MVTNLLDAEIFNNESEHDGSPLVLPEARSGGALVVAINVEEFPKELVGKDSRPEKSINSATNSRVEPSVADAVGEDIFEDEFFEDVEELNVNIFRSIEWSAEIVVADAEGNKFGVPAREDDVDHELEKIE